MVIAVKDKDGFVISRRFSISCKKEWVFFDKSAKATVFFNNKFFTLMRIRQFGDLVWSPTTKSLSQCAK